MDNIQAVLDRLGASNPQLAGEVRNALGAMAAERDHAIARASAAEARAHDLAVEQAKAKLEANGQNAEPYQPEPQRFVLRADFDQFTPRQQMDAVKAGVRIVD